MEFALDLSEKLVNVSLHVPPDFNGVTRLRLLCTPLIWPLANAGVS
jgi:hypothetical protein